MTPTPLGRDRLPVAVVGATGMVGQRFVERLADHPWFQLTHVAASEVKAGTLYRDAATWLLPNARPDAAGSLRLSTLDEVAASRVAAVFSALPSGTAGAYETRLAAAGHRVFTNARDHRMDDGVPLLVPEINPGHLELVRGKPGWIVANGNCSAIILELGLAPLVEPFGLEAVHVTTMQGLSGAGYPGVASLDIVDNILTYIPGEEEKLQTEPEKTFGTLAGGRVVPFALGIQATCTRANVREGHTQSVHVRLRRPATGAALRKAWSQFRGPPDVHRLPSAPRQPIHVHDDPARPQPRLDRDAENGMAVSVGRVRVDPTGRDVRFVLLGSNTVRGAAGQSILNAEHAYASGLLGPR